MDLCSASCLKMIQSHLTSLLANKKNLANFFQIRKNRNFKWTHRCPIDSALSRTVLGLIHSRPWRCSAWLSTVPHSAQRDSALSRTVLSVTQRCPVQCSLSVSLLCVHFLLLLWYVMFHMYCFASIVNRNRQQLVK